MAEIASRGSGIFLLVGAILLGITVVVISLNPVVNQPMSPGISLLMLVSAIFLLLSLPAMYVRQADAAGWMGFAGYILLQIGILLLVVLAAPSLLFPTLQLAPGENPVIFVLGIALTIGLLLTGIATIRANVYPNWAGILLLGAMIGFFFVFFVAEFLPPIAGQAGSAVFGIILAFALSWVGTILWAGIPTLAGR